MAEWKNQLYYGDNLEILRGQHVLPESVDLIYLDPPFNSNASYNVLYRAKDGTPSASQIVAFDDTWEWGADSDASYRDVVSNGPLPVSELMQSFYKTLGDSTMMAYLAMMAPRLVEMHKVLKKTGSICLHCDPTASHYLKLLMDSIFGAGNFRNEIIWQRTAAKGQATRALPSNHDVLLLYRKAPGAVWNAGAMFIPYDLDHLDPKTAKKYCNIDQDGRRYELKDITNPNHNRPNLTYEFLGVTRVWRWTRSRMEAAYKKGLIVQSKIGSVPRFKRYLDEQRGKPVGDVWTDIPPVNSQSRERLGYPTQKPEALLERIIRATTNKGHIVLDPFCGCGTAIVAAERLGRKWVGIDIAYMAITEIKRRLRKAMKLALSEFVEEGTPKTAQDAIEIAESGPDGRYQFQWCILDKLEAQPANGRKKGADRGVDGIKTFFDDESRVPKRILVQVKSGKVKRGDIATLKGDMTTNDAVIGILVTAQPPTRPMELEVLDEGFYVHPCCKSDPVRRIQILTAEDIFAGRGIHYHKLEDTTFQEAPLAKTEQTEDRLL